MSGDVLQSFDVVVVCCLDGCVLMCQNCCFRWRMCLKNAIETGQNVFSQSHLLYRFSKLCVVYFMQKNCHIPCMVVCYSALDRGAEYCDEHVCLSVCVCMFACPRSYLQNYKFHLHQIFCACYLWPWFGFLWWHSDTLCTSGFMDDVIFAHKPRLLDVTAQLKCSAHAALGLVMNCVQ